MRIMTVLSAGCLLAGLIALTAGGTASAQEIYTPALGTPSMYAGALWYPYGCPCLPHHAYRHDVRYGFVPVAPPAKICHGPTDWYGCFFYGPPRYAYPRPPLGCPGYAGFAGNDPNAYRTMVPPPIPTESQANAASPTVAPEQVPTPPAKVATPPQPIPPPPSTPAGK